MNISFFFPAYMDEKTIEPLTELGKKTLGEICDKFEIIIVHDKSPDNTGAVADKLASQDDRVRVIHHPINKGYGGAVWSGIQAAQYEWIFFTDGDMQFDVAELPQYIELTKQFDIIVGYKIKRADPWYRLLISRCYNLAVQLCFGLPIRDINCAFKLMKREIFEGMKLSQDYREAYILIEVFYKATRRGYKICEVPVHHYERQHGVSQSFNLKAALRFLVYPFKASIDAYLLRKWDQ